MRARMTRGLIGLLGAAALATGCTSGASPSASASASSAPTTVTAAQLQDYVAEVEPVRLAVNDLLDEADPILDAYRAHSITPEVAGQQMSELESKFAVQLVAVESIVPADATLRELHRPYADTFIDEDTYLAALAAALPHGEFAELPDTRNDQRRAIVVWRTQLEVLAGQTGASLPDDLQQAGRGEIAPSPTEG